MAFFAALLLRRYVLFRVLIQCIGYHRTLIHSKDFVVLHDLVQVIHVQLKLRCDVVLFVTRLADGLPVVRVDPTNTRSSYVFEMNRRGRNTTMTGLVRRIE